MSTRSGKRIHSTADENVENIVESKTDRSTRSKRHKIEIDLPVTEKKRKNYVRYPSEENVANIQNIAKTESKSRRHTLKERNILTTDSETSNDERKAVRSTRRTKINEGSEEIEQSEPNVATEKNKKGKKNAKPIVTEESDENIPETKTSKKKSNKKKSKRKKSNSVIGEEIHVEKKLNSSNATTDSFLSAVGSPTTIGEDPSNDTVYTNKTKKNKKHDKVESNSSAEKPNRKRKITTEMECDVNNELNNDLNIELLSNLDNESITNEVIEKTQTDEIDKSIETSSKKKKHAKKSKKDKTDTTFEIDNNNVELNSSKLNSTFDKKHSSPNVVINFNTTFDKDSRQSNQDVNNITLSASKKKRKSSITNSTYDKIDNQSIVNLDCTYEKASRSKEEKSLSSNTTAEIKDVNNITLSASKKKRKSSITNSTYDKIDNQSIVNLDGTYEKASRSKEEKSLLSNMTAEIKDINSSKHSLEQNNTLILNNTYDKSPTSHNATFDKPTKLDTTFDKGLKKDSIDQIQMNPQANSSSSILISSDTTVSSTINITDDNSHVSLTSDDSKNENILNITPVLIESSMDDSSRDNNDLATETKNTPLKRQGTFTKESKDSPSNREKETEPITPLKRDTTFTESDVTPKKNTPDSKHTPRRSSIKTPQSTKKITIKNLVTPLKREGTFTKDSPEVTMSPKLKAQFTPRGMSLASPGSTPFPHSKSSSKEKVVLNLTRSIEKSRRSSVVDVPPRMTKVMFCSPVNNPAVVSLMKGKVIKSNLKGSNKSFIFDDSVSECRPGRKRSYTQSEAADERTAQLRSAQRLSRSRTASAAARLQDNPLAKKPTKEARRTKLPNFAALHKKQFQRMESLDECVVRKAKRAKLLLTPNTASKTLRTSPKETSIKERKEAPEASKEAPAHPPKKEVSKSKQSEPNPGYTRFGYKLNLDVNPFSIPSKNEVKEKQPALKRQATLPSLAGATKIRTEIAKQTVMREKSFTEKRQTNRDENRTVIKGVRTNRRFELQMKMRNIHN